MGNHRNVKTTIPERMDKVVVSSIITSLRPKVKQSVVQTIHKYTRQMKLYSKRPGNDESKKQQQRALRLKEEILLMKKLHPDTVIKTALLLDFNDREKLLNDVHEPLDKKVVVRLATHKSVMNYVNVIREKYPEWSSKLPLVLESFTFQKKTRKSKQKKSDTMPNTEINENLETQGNLSSKPTLQETLLCRSEVQKKRVTNKRRRSITVDSDEDLSFNEHKRSMNDHSHVEADSKISSASTHAQVCRLSELFQVPNNADSIHHQASQDEVEKGTKDCLYEEDSFFVTESNDFLKTKVMKVEIKETDSHSPEELHHTKIMKGSQLKDRVVSQGHIKTKPTKLPHSNAKSKFEQGQKYKIQTRKCKNSEFPETEKSLHPSWEAKRRQKFSVNNCFSKNVSSDSQEARLSGSNMQSQKSCQNTNQESILHPSWEAKRKQRALINAFQGKKIKFEDV